MSCLGKAVDPAAVIKGSGFDYQKWQIVASFSPHTWDPKAESSVIGITDYSSVSLALTLHIHPHSHTQSHMPLLTSTLTHANTLIHTHNHTCPYSHTLTHTPLLTPSLTPSHTHTPTHTPHTPHTTLLPTPSHNTQITFHKLSSDQERYCFSSRPCTREGQGHTHRDDWWCGKYYSLFNQYFLNMENLH